MKVNYLAFFILGLSVGVNLSQWAVGNEIKNNTVKGYHCAPITKHVGLESAKAQVLINQKLGERL
tara:strand:- start:306 stop:500 length:195 start_codon:yes stop_codon:yes gene_type:complete